LVRAWTRGKPFVPKKKGGQLKKKLLGKGKLDRDGGRFTISFTIRDCAPGGCVTIV